MFGGTKICPCRVCRGRSQVYAETYQDLKKALTFLNWKNPEVFVGVPTRADLPEEAKGKRLYRANCPGCGGSGFEQPLFGRDRFLPAKAIKAAKDRGLA